MVITDVLLDQIVRQLSSVPSEEDEAEPQPTRDPLPLPLPPPPRRRTLLQSSSDSAVTLANPPARHHLLPLESPRASSTQPASSSSTHLAASASASPASSPASSSSSSSTALPPPRSRRNSSPVLKSPTEGRPENPRQIPRGLTSPSLSTLESSSLRSLPLKPRPRNGSFRNQKIGDIVRLSPGGDQFVVNHDQKTHHHKFALTAIPQVQKCPICTWPIWGYMNQAHQCSECLLVIHESCSQEPNITECPKWSKQNEEFQVEKLASLFPTLELYIVREIFEWADNIETAILQLLQEEAKVAGPVDQGQRKLLAWKELRKIDHSLREAARRKQKILNGPESPTKTEDISALDATQAALHTKRELLVKSLKSSGNLAFYPTSLTTSIQSDFFVMPDTPTETPTPTSTPSGKKTLRSLFPDALLPLLNQSGKRAKEAVSVRTESEPEALQSWNAIERTQSAHRKWTPLTEIFRRAEQRARAVHVDNDLSPGDLKKGSLVHPYIVVKHKETLESEILQRRQTVIELGVRLEKLAQQLFETLKSLKTQSLGCLKTPVLDHYFAERGLMEVKMSCEESCIRSLQQRVDFMQASLNQLTSEDEIISNQLLLASKAYLAHDPLVVCKRHFVGLLERRLKEKEHSLNLAKKAVKTQCSVALRKARVLEILSVNLTEETCKYPLDAQAIGDFTTILSDARMTNGRWFQNAVSHILSLETPPSSEISDFLFDYAQAMATEFKILDQWYLGILLDCSFFGLTHTHIIKGLDTPALAAADELFLRAQPILREKNPKELLLSTKHLPDTIPLADDSHSLLPFHEAMDVLSDIPFLHAPIEILLCLSRALDLICREAAALNATKPKKSHFQAIAADDILPIFIFVAIHTDLGRVNLLLKFLEVYTDVSLSRGRLGYCLTTFEGAVLDITTHLAPQAMAALNPAEQQP